jgi:aromatic ring-opening dioxygenase catalytic subunit (LigB family)
LYGVERINITNNFINAAAPFVTVCAGATWLNLVPLGSKLQAFQSVSPRCPYRPQGIGIDVTHWELSSDITRTCAHRTVTEDFGIVPEPLARILSPADALTIGAVAKSLVA